MKQKVVKICDAAVFKLKSRKSKFKAVILKEFVAGHFTEQFLEIVNVY